MKQFYIKAYNSAVKHGNNQLRKMIWAENKDDAYDEFYKQFEKPGKFIINYPIELKEDEKKRRNKIREAVIEWYREHAKKKINERVKKYKVKLDVEPNNVVIKKQKKRWGSCSNKGNLNFNWKIIMAPMSIVDYLVVHELTHLIYDNHSGDFWNTVESIIPKIKEKKEWLRVNGKRLDIG